MIIEIGKFYLADTELVYVFDFSDDEPYKEIENIIVARAIKVECVLYGRKYLDFSDSFATIPVAEDTHSEAEDLWICTNPSRRIRQQFQEAIGRHADSYEKITSCFRCLNKVIAVGESDE